MIGDQTLGRRAVNLLAQEARGRVNALFVGIFFLGGAAGSGVAGYAWTQGGWPLVCAAGAGFGALSLLSDLLGVVDVGVMHGEIIHACTLRLPG